MHRRAHGPTSWATATLGPFGSTRWVVVMRKRLATWLQDPLCVRLGESACSGLGRDTISKARSVVHRPRVRVQIPLPTGGSGWGGLRRAMFGRRRLSSLMPVLGGRGGGGGVGGGGGWCPGGPAFFNDRYELIAIWRACGRGRGRHCRTSTWPAPLGRGRVGGSRAVREYAKEESFRRAVQRWSHRPPNLHHTEHRRHLRLGATGRVSVYGGGVWHRHGVRSRARSCPEIIPPKDRCTRRGRRRWPPTSSRPRSPTQTAWCTVTLSAGNVRGSPTGPGEGVATSASPVQLGPRRRSRTHAGS